MIAELSTAAETTEPETAGTARWWTRYPARMADWTPELRSEAARAGWRRRRAGPTPHQRRTLLLRHGDPRVLRLLAYDLAEGVLHHYTERCPGDLRPLLAIQVARRYAAGLVKERDRLAAFHLSGAAVGELWPHEGRRCTAPAYCAANAAGFTGWKRAE